MIRNQQVVGSSPMGGLRNPLSKQGVFSLYAQAAQHSSLHGHHMVTV